MSNDSHATLKFPKVRPIGAPPSQAPDRAEPPASRSSTPGVEPDFYEEDIVTQRGLQVAFTTSSRPDRAMLTVLTGLNLGQVFTVDQAEVSIGRGRDAQVRIEDVGISRKHARILHREGEYILQDLGSSNGVFVNGRRVESVRLSDGDRVQVGPTVVLRFGLLSADEEAVARQLYEGSTRDGLTRLYNRRYAAERLAMEVAYAHRHSTAFSVILFDLDYFKRVNDTYGHLAGDVVLRIVGAQVQKTIRTEDVLARYGGEEFIVLVRGVEHKNACVLAERIRKSVEQLAIPWESRTLKVTVSIGVVSLSECKPKGTVDSMLALADERLYSAKAGGRNRVC